MRELTLACRRILQQIENVVVAISNEDYRRPSTTLSQATVGQHVRHILDFFICLEIGCHEGIVNYDKRARDQRIEEDRIFAIGSIRRIRDFVIQQENQESLVLEVRYMDDTAGFLSIPTSYQRELAYAIEHAVHHMAIIKIGLREVAPGVHIDRHFGVAASTVRYKEDLLKADDAAEEAFMVTVANPDSTKEMAGNSNDAES